MSDVAEQYHGDVELAASKLLTSESGEDRLESSQRVRTAIVADVLSKGLDDVGEKDRTFLRGLLADSDRNELNRLKLTQDNTNEASRNKILEDVYLELAKNNGTNINLNNDSTVVVASTDIELPDDEFEIGEGELKQGNLTEESAESLKE